MTPRTDATLLARLADAAMQAEKSEARRRKLIDDGLAAGISHVEIAAAAQLSKQRIGQLAKLRVEQ